jgi:hypothetical protein
MSLVDELTAALIENYQIAGQRNSATEVAGSCKPYKARAGSPRPSECYCHAIQANVRALMRFWKLIALT